MKSLLLTTCTSPAQTQAQPAGLDFDTASIHLSNPAQPGFQAIKPMADGAGYLATYVPVKLMIAFMYRIPARQVKGGPAWLEDDRYDVEAKTDRKYTVDDLNTMYQNLLADRFHLKFHLETREANDYVLTLDKGGSRMKRNSQPQDYSFPITFSGNGIMHGVRVPMPYFCWTLGQILQGDQRPVVDPTDLTGLTGFYDFTLTYLPLNVPQQAQDTVPQETLDCPSLFDALKQQLGLRLTARKAPVQYFIIDHIERPTAN